MVNVCLHVSNRKMCIQYCMFQQVATCSLKMLIKSIQCCIASTENSLRFQISETTNQSKQNASNLSKKSLVKNSLTFKTCKTHNFLHN